MSALKYFFFNKYILWIFLAIPAILTSIGFINGNIAYEELMHISGEFSVRTLVFSLIATPLIKIFPKFRFPKWLLRNRRYFGVAAFAYTLLHTIFYLYEIAFDQVMSEFLEIGIVTGWLTFFIFVPLALSSNDYSVRLMKQNWKRLQRWVYLASIMVLLHWGFIHGHWGGAIFHAAPVVVFRLWAFLKK